MTSAADIAKREAEMPHVLARLWRPRAAMSA